MWEECFASIGHHEPADEFALLGQTRALDSEEHEDDAGPAWIRGELIAFNAEEHVRAAMTDKIILDTSFLSTMALSLSS